MVNPSSLPKTSLESLLHEIEAIPREYWTDLPDTLSQFRQQIPSTTSPIVNAEQVRKNQAARDRHLEREVNRKLGILKAIEEEESES